jgi:branched-chain amino acid transport system permease protein
MTMKKRNLLLSSLLSWPCSAWRNFVQTEMDAYIRRIVNLCMIYAIIGLSMNITNGFVPASSPWGRLALWL